VYPSPIQEIPEVIHGLKHDRQNVDHELVLYTDADVVFTRDINSCTLPRPKVALVGPEVGLCWGLR